MINVLFVCLGNICRSPLAEGLFIQKVKNQGLEGFFKIDSCGTGDYHIGELPDRRTRENAERNGLKLDSRARQFITEDFGIYHYIIPMDRSNMANVLRLSPGDKEVAKVMMMRSFDAREPDSDVPDPYFGGEQGFQHVYDILDRSTDALLAWLIGEHDLDQSMSAR